MRPTLRALLLLLVGFVAAILPVVVGGWLWTVWLAYVGAWALLVGVDAALALGRGALNVKTSVPEEIEIGSTADATVALAAAGSLRRTALRVHADVTGDLAAPPETTARLGPGGRATVRIPLTPTRRGTVGLATLWLRWNGPLGLAAKVRRVRTDASVRVGPNVSAARAHALRLLHHRDAWVGWKVVRHEGEGSEFEALREYTPGLDPRGLDWKASARHRMLISAEFRAERNHQIVLGFDTGRLMREPVDGVPKLDHAVSAGLVLAYTSLRYGDRVGAFAFDETVRAWMEPRGGVRTFARVQRLAADLAYRTTETNFTLGLADLSARLHRRSFVVLLTDFVDTVTAELMVENLGRLARRHLVTFVALRDPHLDRVVGTAPGTERDVLKSVVADDVLKDRELVLRRLGRLGIHCIDAAPQAVTERLLNRYLDAKRRELVA